MEMKIKALAAIACLLAFSNSASASALLPQFAPYGFGVADSDSWLAGAQIGYNWQQGLFVYGLQADLSGTHLRSTSSNGFSAVTTPIPDYTYPTGNASANIDWYGTLRGRVGVTVGSFLFYGTGGLAYGGVGLTNNYNPGSGATTPGALNGQTSGVRAGWVVGAGGEYLLTRNLSLNFEYLYVDLGSFNLAAQSFPANALTYGGPSAAAHAQFQTITVGLNWHFLPPETAVASSSHGHHNDALLPASNPWQGVYVGGHVGGARGNTLSVTSPGSVPALERVNVE
jgi:outer membrane immunogenic protein